MFKNYVEPKTLLCATCFKGAKLSPNALDDSHKTMVIECDCGQFEVPTTTVLIPVRIDVKKKRVLITNVGRMNG